MTKAEIRKRLECKLSERLYRHSIATESMSTELAERYSVDRQKAELAGLLHDCGRDLSGRELLLYAKQHNIPLDQIQLSQPTLLHAPVSAKMAQIEFGIEDDEILHAIEVHSLGAKKMSKLDKILYVADSSEPNRDYPGVEGVRKLAYSGNLDLALLEAMEIKIIYVIRQRLILHPISVEVRNEILANTRLSNRGY